MEFDFHTLMRYQSVLWYGLWMTVVSERRVLGHRYGDWVCSPVSES